MPQSDNEHVPEIALPIPDSFDRCRAHAQESTNPTQSLIPMDTRNSSKSNPMPTDNSDVYLYMFTNLRSGMVGIRGSIVQL